MGIFGVGPPGGRKFIGGLGIVGLMCTGLGRQVQRLGGWGL